MSSETTKPHAKNKKSQMPQEIHRNRLIIQECYFRVE